MIFLKENPEDIGSDLHGVTDAAVTHAVTLSGDEGERMPAIRTLNIEQETMRFDRKFGNYADERD